MKQEPLDNDINQDFQDAIDVMQRHSEIFYYDSGDLINYNWISDTERNKGCFYICLIVLMFFSLFSFRQ